LATVAELNRQGVLYHGDRAPSVIAAAQSPEAQSVEAWLTGSHAPASSSPMPSALAALPSALGRAVIPSLETPSQILASAAVPDGTSNAPIPLTMPIRERTPEPEPIQDDQILLSRHTVPANQAVLLTQPAA